MSTDAVPARSLGEGPNALTRKLGPLPTYAWGAIIVGIAVVFTLWRRSQSQNGFVTEDPGNGALNAGDLSSEPAFGSSGSDGTGSGDNSSTTDTNAAWAARAVAWLITQGDDPIVASNAVNAYINGQTLTAAQGKLISKVLASGIGTPPQGILPIKIGGGSTGTGGGGGGGGNQQNGAFLRTGQSLNPGQSISSADGKLRLVFQGDGNLVLYGPGNRVVWTTSTSRKGATKFVNDGGRLRLLNARGGEVWAAGDKSNPATLFVQDDGNLVLRDAGDNAVLWNSHTAQYANAKAGEASRVSAQTYTVQNGDSFGSISGRFYGDSAFSSQIEDANPGASATPGTVLTIPRIDNGA